VRVFFCPDRTRPGCGNQIDAMHQRQAQSELSETAFDLPVLHEIYTTKTGTFHDLKPPLSWIFIN